MRHTPATRPAVRFALLVAAALAGGAEPAVGAEPVRWRTDYNAARKEAQEKGLPLFLDIGTENCFYCRKLEATTFTDPAVAALLAGDFIPLKVDANREPALAAALKVKLYPTLVLAGADGKIHGFLEGYQDADRLADNLKRTSLAASTNDYAGRDFQEATRAMAAADYPRAATLLKGVARDAADKPVGVKARQVLAEIEKQAAGRVARAKDLDRAGRGADAMDALAEVVKAYAGTDAAADAAVLMAGLADAPEARERRRVQRARDGLAAAKEEFRTERYFDCLQHCEQVAAAGDNTPEAKEADALAAEVKANPERLATACEQMTERTATLYLTLAESWAKKGQPKEATACLEKVLTLAPNSRHAEVATGHLARLQGRDGAVPTGFRKTAP